MNKTKTIYICKDKKTEFVYSLKQNISKLSYVAEEFFSKLFDKNDKLSKIKDYYKENTFNDNDELKKIFFNEKEINENLTIDEAKLKNNSILFLFKENENMLIIFEEDEVERKFTIMCKPYELISTLIERYRNESNNFNKNTRFFYNDFYLDESLLAIHLQYGATIKVL